MISQYVICVVFTKDKPDTIRIETIMYYGTIEHEEGAKPKDVFDKEKAVEDALKEEKSMKLLKSGHSFFLSNHTILPRIEETK